MAGVVLLTAGCGRGGTAGLPAACGFPDGGGTSKPASDAPAAATPSPSTGGSPPSHAPNKGTKT